MSNKEAALDFLQLVVTGKIDEAYHKHVNMAGKHHNVYYPAGFPALKYGMEANHEQFPHKKFHVKHALGDGEFVAVHSHVILIPKEREVSVVHLFRFEHGKIVELWDCGQTLPEELPNTDGAF